MTSPHATPDPDERRAWLSDLADGRLHGESLAVACREWADDHEARRTWHAYHLIGDVLRSDDLARPAGGDAAFLAALRSRLADEPVVLAPAPVALRPRRQVWLLPVAAAAGFVAVAGVVVVLQQVPLAGAGAQLAASPPPPTIAVRAGAGTAAPITLVGTDAVGVPRGQMLRDARVDEYLRAHREMLVGSPVALPGGGVRAVDFDNAAATAR